MDDFMISILSRVLSQEIGNQKRWAREEQEKYGISSDREYTIDKIKAFMEENEIEIRPDYF